MKPILTYGVAALGLAAVTTQVAHWTVNPGLECDPDLPPSGAFMITATGGAALASTSVSGVASQVPTVVPNTIEGEDRVAGTVEVFRVGPIFRRV
ncbi:MAG: hypothetical protein RLO06_09115 [Parvibaculum sp.]